MAIQTGNTSLPLRVLDVKSLAQSVKHKLTKLVNVLVNSFIYEDSLFFVFSALIIDIFVKDVEYAGNFPNLVTFTVCNHCRFSQHSPASVVRWLPSFEVLTATCY